MPQCSVLRVNRVEEQTAYRDAVAETIRRILSEHHTTLLQISERIDVSLGTISNAFNKKADLNSTYLKRLGEAYGPHSLDPFARLFGGRVIPLEAEAGRDVLPFVSRVALSIAEARDPQSPGGAREVLQEKLGYLTHLRSLRRELDVLIHQIEAERDAA